MMSGAKKRVPKRRFKEFLNAGDWEQRKLDELTISIGDGLHGTPKYDENGSYYFINGNNLVDSKVSVTEETKKVAFEALSNDDRRLDSTSILMSINGTIGTLARYNNENIMLGKSVAYITPKNINRDFLFYQLQGNVIQSYFYKNLTGTTIKNLGLGTIKNAIVMSTLSEEESKIGQFFYKLDQHITLHQRKLDKLQATKKALLQEMFPEEGQDKPKRRFKGFTDAWEQRKLLTVLNKIVDYRGRTPKKLGLDWSPTGHLALSALNVKMGYVDKTVDAHYGDDHLYSVWMKDNDLYKGQVLFTTEAPMGNVAQVPDDNKYILSQRTIAFVPDRRVISDNFLAVVLSASKCQKSLINRASGGTAKGVSQKTLSEISLDIPQSLSEQDKVSELIKKLSKIITLHQRKLDKLKNLKQAYLNEMFV